jgi:cell division transport system ATP-binding protein
MNRVDIQKYIFCLENISIAIKGEIPLKVSLKVKNGDFIIIKGKNSSGKSMLLKLFYLKCLPNKGKIFFKGNELKNSSKDLVQEFRKKIGVILQNDFLIPFLNVYQNIEIACEIQRNTKNIESRMNEIFNWLSLENIKNEKIQNLSNSQKQKVVIARALINNPKLILADQPETFLDSDFRKKLMYLFSSLNKLGSTIIMTTNDLSQFDESCRIITLDT